MRVEILDGVLPTAEVIEQIKAGADGAVCVFDGIVRNNTRGRQTLYLDYEAEPRHGARGDAGTRRGGH